MKKINIKYSKLSYATNESYKTLRTNLLFCGEEKKVIALTSCTPNEGKSSVSMNLAISLVESGKKVLLIDADLRKSVLKHRTDVQEEIKGLSHYLSQQVALDQVIYSTNIPYFHIIYAGVVPPNPAELLGSKHFKNLLKMVKDIYDYVIIDCPPLGSVVDAAIVAEECDGSILVIESGVISYRYAQEIKEQLAKAACPILGVVLNKVDMKKNGYYGKYGHYGHYGKE